MIELQLIIPNKLGLHARTAAKLVSVASCLEISLQVSRNGKKWVDARNIMGLLMLGASQGTPLQFRIDGKDAIEGEAALRDLFSRNFDEESGAS